MTTGNAVVAYQTMLRDLIAPALRAEGLKGSGQTYEIAGDRHVGKVHFERSLQNSAERVRFRVILNIEPRQVPSRPARSPIESHWLAWLTDLVPSRPPFQWWLLRDKDSPENPPGRWNVLTGESFPSRGEIWGQGYYDSADPASVAADVLAALKQWGMPALRQELARLEASGTAGDAHQSPDTAPQRARGGSEPRGAIGTYRSGPDVPPAGGGTASSPIPRLQYGRTDERRERKDADTGLGSDLVAQLARHRAAGSAAAGRVVERGQARSSGLARARALHHSGPSPSWLTLAKFYREALDELPAHEKVSASVVLLAEAAQSAWPPNTMMRAVSRARPPFSVGDLQLLLALDPVRLGAAPASRLEYLSIVLDRVVEMSGSGAEGVAIVAAELATRLANWQSTDLVDRDHIRLRKLCEQALRASGSPPAEAPEA